MLICRYTTKNIITGEEKTHIWDELVANELEAIDVKIRLEKAYMFSGTHDLVGFETEEKKGA